MKCFNKNNILFTTIFGICFSAFPYYTNAQTVSTKGQDFWLGYGAHAAMFNADGSVDASGGTQDMVLYLSAGTTTQVKVEMPLTGWSTSFTIPAGIVNAQVIIPKTGGSDARLTQEGLFNKGIHITSDQPINAWCHIYSQGSSAASLLLPEEILAQEYFTLGATQASAENNSFAWCFVVGTEDGTQVEITPSANTLQRPAGVPFTIQLKRGQVYNLIGEQTGKVNGINKAVDLTGTHIRVLNNNTGPCKKVAVFTGSSSTLISCSQTGSADNLFQQVLPYKAWGKGFFGLPTKGTSNARYRVLVSAPTKVTVNGNLLTGLINGSYYEFDSGDKPVRIISSNPVMVAQYIPSQGQCANAGSGDPEMTYLTPGVFWVSHVLINLPASPGITTQYINVVLKTAVVDSFYIDGAKKSSFFNPYTQDPSYSWAQIPLTAGQHSIDVDSLSFGAIAYGYGPLNSYAYNTYFSITRLSTINVKNPYSTPDQLKACKGTPFSIVYSLKKKATRLTFDFLKNPSLAPNNIVDIQNPVPDSFYISGPDSFYRYTLPAKYVFANGNTTNFTVNITETIPTDEGCIEERFVPFTITLVNKPQAGIGISYNTCGDDTLHFKNNSTFEDGYFTNWLWDFGNKTDTTGVSNPVKFYTAYGDYKVKLRAITNNGCYADTAENVSLNPLPKANFTQSGFKCPLNDIQFKDASTIINGWQITRRTWDFGDGTSSTTANPVKQYSAPGNYKVKLYVYSNKDCVDSIIQPLVIYGANPYNEFVTVKNPLAAVSNLKACSQAPFYLSATFTTRLARLTWDFATNPLLSPNGSVDITTPAPDSAYSNGQDSFFRYSLNAGYVFSGNGNLPVKITGFVLTQGGCTVQTVFNHTIQVIAKPVALWQLTYNKCSNDILFFKDGSTAAGDNITSFAWDFNDGSTSADINPVKKYAGYGNYNVALHITTENGCFDDTIAPVVLSPSPVAAFNFAAPLFCTNNNIAFTDESSIQQPFTINRWLWAFGDGTTQTVKDVTKPFVTAGDFNVSLIVYTAADCADTATKNVHIYAYPTITYPAEIFIPAEQPFQISPAYTGTGLTYLWQPATWLNKDTVASPVTTATEDITYNETVIGDGGCQANTSVIVHVEKPVGVPNAFSPNGDGINDTWRITNIEGHPNTLVRIFNRDGQLVFNSAGYTKPWDGTLDGKPLPMGVYYYIIDIKSKIFPGKTGSVTILR